MKVKILGGGILACLCLLFSSVTAQESIRKITNDTSTAEVLRVYQELLEASGEGRSLLYSKIKERDDLRVRLVKFDLAFRLARNPSWSDLQKSRTLQSLLDLDTRDSKHPSAIGSMHGAEADLVLIRKYIDIASLNSQSEQKKAFFDSTVADRKDVWRTRLAVHLAMEPLTRPQQMLVLELLTLLDNESVYSDNVSTELRAKFDDFEKRAREQFGKAETYRLFMSLGNATGCPPPSGDAVPGGGRCTCYYSAYCEILNEWTSCLGGCTPAGGCGIIFNTECVGTCR